MLKRQKSFAKDRRAGVLYLVPTPIGNLEDITLRALRILAEVDLIASEDTRNTLKLLNYFEIKKKQVSFHQHNFKVKVPRLLFLLEDGAKIAQVSDAGMPLLSDPGQELVDECLKRDVSVIALPGATAGVTALVASGLSSQPFVFYGFLPRKKKDQLAFLKKKVDCSATQIFYESPFRIKETLKTIAQVYGEKRPTVLCRELTKIHEEYLRGECIEILEEVAKNPIRGEVCLLVAGRKKDADLVDNEELQVLTIKQHVEKLVETENISAKEAIKEVAKLRRLKKQEVYSEYHEIAKK